MKRFHLVVAAVAAFALLTGGLFPGSLDRARAAELPSTVTLEADEIEHDVQAETIEATGDAHFTANELSLWTQGLNLNLAEHLALAAGPVKLQDGDRTLTGKNLRYDWEAGRGELETVKTSVDGLLVDSADAQFDKSGYHLDGASVTKCDLPEPEYAFKSRDITIDAQTNRLKAQGVDLWLFGHKILPLPNMQMSLADTRIGRMSREELPVPEVGYETGKGYYVSEQLSYLLGDKALARVRLEYGTEQKFGSRLFLAREVSPATLVTVDGRYAQQGLNRPNEWDGSAVVTTSGGGVNGRLAWEIKHDEYYRDLKFWPEVSLSKSIDLGFGSLSPNLSWAKIDEATSGVATERAEANLDWRALPISLGTARLAFSGSARFDDYNSHGQRRVVDARATLSRRLTPALSGSIAYVQRVVTGESPFHFDDLDPAKNLILAGALRTGLTNMNLSATYDLDTGEVDLISGGLTLGGDGSWQFRVTASYEPLSEHLESLNYRLIRETHCFEYRLQYDGVEKRIEAGVALRR